MSHRLDEAQIVDEGMAQGGRRVQGVTQNAKSSFENSEETTSRRRTSARDVLPIDNEVRQYFPCPVTKCDAVYQNRAERSYHIRTDHPGYKYKEGDGMEKLREPQTVSQPLAQYEEEEEEDTILNVVDEPPFEEKMTEDGMSDYSEDPQEDPKYMHQLSMNPPKDDWNSQLSSTMSHDYIMEDASSSQMADNLTTGNFQRDGDVYKRNILTGPRRRGRPKNPPGAEPAPNSKVRVPDPTGKYRCYIPECPWRGGYRSIRAEHMKYCHKDWKMPPRYILQRMSRDGVFYNKPPEGDFACLVEGCEWRGNYRASRSSHMRSQHPDYQPAKRKAPQGGYVINGKYACHEPTCEWKGASRSTRAAHMKRMHPGYLSPMYQPKMLLCPDCNVQCCTHKTFVDHLVLEHRIGGSVQREFNGIEDYEVWYEAVQDSFSVEFIKKVANKQNEAYQVTYLYCAKSSRLKQMKSHPYVSQYMKQRQLSRPYRVRNHCAAFLRVLHWTDGKLTVVGCVEHTGHRLGTSILRLSPAEREVLDEFIYVNDDEIPMDNMLDKFREMEGYVVEGYNVSMYNEAALADYILDKDDERASLKKLLESDLFANGSAFDVKIPGSCATESELHSVTFGIMTPEMQKLWKTYGGKISCFEEVRLMIGTWNLSLIFVLVFTEDNSPRCCCVYIANSSDRQAVLKRLQQVSPQAPQTLVTDMMMDWAMMLDSVYGESAYNTELLTAEWHMLAEWAANLDNLVPNRVDRFTIFACLRRWLRATEPALFDVYVVEMFEAFRELGIEEISQTLDGALTDPEYLKRWSPLNRSGITEHSNPTIDLACRNFRDRFLNAENCSRLDQYVGLLMSRLPEFNKCQISEPVAHGTVEPMRPIPIYEIVEPASTVLADGSVIVHQSGNQMIIEDVDENGQEYSVDENSHIIEGVIQEEIVGDYAEEVEVEEEIVMDIDPTMPSTSEIIFEEDPRTSGTFDQNQEFGDVRVVDEIQAEQQRKDRVSLLLETIQKNPGQLKMHHLDILETSLSQVVQQLEPTQHDNPTE